MNESLNLATLLDTWETYLSIIASIITIYTLLFREFTLKIMKKLNIFNDLYINNLKFISLLFFIAALVSFVSATLSTENKNYEIISAERAAISDRWDEYNKDYSDYINFVNACIANKGETLAAGFDREFSEFANVRCPGGGCFLQSGSCNARRETIRYEAPGGYYIDTYVPIRGNMNDGDLGSLAVSSRDSESRVTGITAELWCDPADYPGAGGGWAEATIKGTIRPVNDQELVDEILEICQKQFQKPQAPAKPRP